MRRLFFAVSATMFVDSLLYLAIVPLLPWYADEFGLSKVGAALGIGAGIVASRIGERVGSFRIAMIGGVGLGVMPWLLALPLEPWMILAVLVAIGPFFPILMTGIFPLMTSAADDLGLSHGTANALANMVWSAGFAIVPLAIAPIAEALGDPVAYVLSGALVVGLLAFATIMRARSRSLSLSY